MSLRFDAVRVCAASASTPGIASRLTGKLVIESTLEVLYTESELHSGMVMIMLSLSHSMLPHAESHYQVHSLEEVSINIHLLSAFKFQHPNQSQSISINRFSQTLLLVDSSHLVSSTQSHSFLFFLVPKSALSFTRTEPWAFAGVKR